MNRLLIITQARNLLKNKFMTLVQIGGLVIGFCIVLFLFVKVDYEYSYDTFWKDYQSIYRVALDLEYPDGRKIKSAKNFHGSTELLDEEVPGVITHCNMSRDMITVYYQDKVIQDVDWFWSDTTFFSVFERKILYSESENLFGDLHGIVISESFARKLFGDENPVNKEISLNEGWKFLVKGVFEDIPSNSFLKVDVLGSYMSLTYFMRNYDPRNQVLIDNPSFVYQKPSPYVQKRWTSSMQFRPHCYIRFENNKNIAELETATSEAIKKVGLPESLINSRMKFIYQPVASIHLHSNLDNELNTNGSAMQVNFLMIIAMVVLVVCLVNYINLSTISTISERKSYSIRLLNGAPKLDIFLSLIIRNLFLFICALLIAVVLAFLLLRQQTPQNSLPILLIPTMACLVLFGTIITSLIPYLSIFSTPIFISLKGQSCGTKHNWNSRKMLVVAQFAITIILVISTIGIYKQMNFVINKNLGFNGSQTVFSYTPMTITNHPDIPAKLVTFRNEVQSLPGVSSFTVSSSVPGRDIRRWNENVNPVNSAEQFGASFNIVSIDNQFLDTYGISLLAGENFIDRSDWTSDEVLINRCAAEKMGFGNPVDALSSTFSIGQNSYRVKGVIENYHHVSLHHQIMPAIYFQNLQWEMSVGYYSFKLTSSNISGVMKDIEKIWERLYPGDEFVFNFSEKEFESQYCNDLNFNRILSFSAILALIISSLGLLSLSMFNTSQRIKEIGIRKVNGARISEVLVMLNKDFVKWVAIAFVIAGPIAYYALNKWLENFAYKTELSWWMFVLAGLLALGIALLTVSLQSWKAARRNPVEALRYE
ncbi:MAG: ABC transporter permease [Prolixibacteraceae bacterium]|nr:ABC transporter permease [Prolixibacteraceae bacterium]